MKKLLVLMVSAIMVIALAACGTAGSADNTTNAPADNGNAAASSEAGTASGDAEKTDGGDAVEGEITVELEIDYPDGSGVRDVEDVKYNVPSNSSALDVLQLYAKENNFEVVMDESSPTAYVISVNGVEATDSAGWIYELNDESIMEQASDVIVAQGDEVSWSFEEWSDMD